MGNIHLDEKHRLFKQAPLGWCKLRVAALLWAPIAGAGLPARSSRHLPPVSSGQWWPLPLILLFNHLLPLLGTKPSKSVPLAPPEGVGGWDAVP